MASFFRASEEMHAAWLFRRRCRSFDGAADGYALPAVGVVAFGCVGLSGQGHPPNSTYALRHKSTRRRASCLYVPPECGGGAVLDLFLLARFLGFTHEDLLNLPKSLFQFLQPRHQGLTGGVLMDLARDLQLKHPVCSLDAATAMGGHHHRAMPATQQFIDLRFAAAVQR